MSNEALVPGSVVPSTTAWDPGTNLDRPVVLPGRMTLVTFLRGTWCPACRAFIDRISPVIPEVKARDIDLVGVVCQGRHWVSSWLAVNPLQFSLLVDEERAVAKAWGVYRLLGLDGVNIAKPAMFLIDPAGKVLWSYVGAHLFDRPGNEAILAAIDAVTASRVRAVAAS